MDEFSEVFRWYVVTLAVTITFAPLTKWFCRRLPGHGVWFARPISLLALVWPAWFLSSITPIPFSNLTLWSTLTVGTIITWGPTLRRRQLDRDWFRSLLLAEAIFLTTFIAFLIFKGFTPRIVGNEKPMDVGFLAATMRATSMPPADPWLAGETINYYYLGYLLNGAIARIAEIPSWVAYNLTLASTFAMTIVAALGLAGSLASKLLTRRHTMLAAVASGFLVVLAGTPYTISRLLNNPRHTWSVDYQHGPGLLASRVIIDDPNAPERGLTINEFPSFSFILGDLHPHLMALPFTLVALALALSFALHPRNDCHSSPASRTLTWKDLMMSGVIIGALYPLNSWDFPTYFGVAAIGLFVHFGLTRALATHLVVFGATSIIAWSPFWRSFVPFAGREASTGSTIPGLGFITKNIALYSGPKTTPGEFLAVFGTFWIVTVLYLVIETIAETKTTQSGRDPRSTGRSPQFQIIVIALGAGLTVLTVVQSAPVLLLAGMPMLLAARLALIRWQEESAVSAIIPVLCALSYGITILTEIFYLRDIFDSRKNTLFKIYYQVWAMLGIACAVALLFIWQRAIRNPEKIRTIILIGAIVLTGLAYPIVAIHARTRYEPVNHDHSWQGFDGLDGHADDPGSNPPITTGHSPDDVAAIRWLTSHAQAGDILLEAPGCQYELVDGLPTSRFSAFTGIPTVIGWVGSETEWRREQPELISTISTRIDDVATMYTNPDPTTNPLFDQYGITLLIVGDLERYPSDRCDIAGPYASVLEPGYPGPSWQLVFESGNTQVYRRSTH